ncbi:MAG: ABC transporter permease [Candidatus Puniceispirillaceae bacterium]
MTQSSMARLIDIVILPFVNLLAAFAVSGIIIAMIGENPFHALGVMIKGAFYYKGALGYTLYYTTNFIFTGLAVAVAFHALLFNIGGEGQAAMGGLAIGLVALLIDSALPALLVVFLAIMGAALFGAIWGAIPGYLQAKRGSHIVITTIMFNFIAASIMVWLLAGPLIAPGQMSPETSSFADGVALAKIHVLAGYMGIDMARSPLNLSFIVSLICCVGVWVLIWRSRLGYAIRATGFSEKAAIYGGHQPARIIMITMAISGALAGMMALNEILGVQHRVILNFTAGYGFTGIAVALMGRNHPVGIIFASLLFGVLYQGGAELDFEFQTITREMVLMIQGLIILFSGALAYMFNPPLQKYLMAWFVTKQEEVA